MPGFHLPELIIILVVALLIFGPKKLPEMGSAIGKAITEFRKGMSELTAPKDEHEEENKLPASTADMGKLSATAAESNATINTTKTTSESSNTEVKVD